MFAALQHCIENINTIIIKVNTKIKSVNTNTNNEAISLEHKSTL